jgi:hypothetical protein
VDGSGTGYLKTVCEQMKEQVGEHHFGEERAEFEAAQAEGVVRERLTRLGC